MQVEKTGGYLILPGCSSFLLTCYIEWLEKKPINTSFDKSLKVIDFQYIFLEHLAEKIDQFVVENSPTCPSNQSIFRSSIFSQYFPKGPSFPPCFLHLHASEISIFKYLSRRRPQGLTLIPPIHVCEILTCPK